MYKSAKLILFALLAFGLALLPGVSFSSPDNYIGDSAIYVGDAGKRARPNVLFVLDTSLASLDPAGSGPYVTPFSCSGSEPTTDPESICTKTGDYSTPPAVDPFDPEQIYESSVTGVWTAFTGGLTLAEVAGCVGSREYDDSGTTRTDNKNVQAYLAEYGTYTGVGDAWYPSLTLGNCDTASGKGGTYATGDYLNFVNHEVVIGDSGTAAKVYHAIQGNRYAVFTAKREHTVPDLATYTNNKTSVLCDDVVLNNYNGQCSEPHDGPNDTLYWTKGTVYSNEDDIPADVPAWLPGLTYTGPTLVDYETQREVFYAALKTVITSKRADLNFGVMTYNYAGNQGGKIIEETASNTSTHVQNLMLDADLKKFLYLMPKGTYTDSTGTLVAPADKADPNSYTIAGGFGPPTIKAGPQRPLAEAMYDAGAYFKAAYPGAANINETKTIDDTPDTTVSNCDYNHIILITNGLPNSETTATNYYASINETGDWDGDKGDNPELEASYGQGTHYLDDVTGYLHDTQDLTIYTVLAFQGFDLLLEKAALEGGSDQLYLANSAGDLAAAFDDIFNNIVAEKDTAFVAPVVPASTTNRTISSNRVYLGLFKPQTNAAWRGNVKKYQVKFGTVDVLAGESGADATDGDGGFIEATKSYWGTGTDGTDDYIFAAEETKPILRPALRPLETGDGGIVDAGGTGGSLKARRSLGEDFFTRKLFSYVGSTKTYLREEISGTPTYISSAALGVTDTERTLLVDWLYGYDAYNDANRYGSRNWLMGDVLHSRPLVFNYGNYADALESTCEEDDAGDGYNSSLVFVGGNDGMLHAFRDCDGKEVWGFVPPMLLPRLQYLPRNTHYTFVDGAPTLYVHDTLDDGIIDKDQGDKVILLFGLRRGGGNNTLAILDEDGDLNTQVPRGAYYALDVTDPDIPVMLWEITSDTAGYAELAETWGQPRLGLMKDSSDVKWLVALVTAGYDQNEDLRWGGTQTFPDDTDHETDTTEVTIDGGAVTSAGTSSAYNPKGRGLFAIKLAWLEPSTLDIVNDAGTTVTVNKVKPNFTGSGGLLWKFTYGSTDTTSVASGTSSQMTYSFPSDMSALDLNGDGLIDRIYVADTGGRMWRFDDDGNPHTFDLDGGNAWTGQIIFSSNPGYAGSLDADGDYVATADSTNGRKIFYKPAVTVVKGNPVLYFGTGDREHPLNYNVVDRVYSLIDRGQNYSVSDALPNADADGNRTEDVTEAHMIDLTANTIQNGTAIESLQVRNALASPTNFGWYIKLENSGEKSLAAPVVFAGQAFYTTYAPNLVIDNPCEVGNLGSSRLYHLDFKTGEAIYNYFNDADQTANTGNERASKDGNILLKADRVKTLGVGIPSGIVTLIDASGKVTMLISASNRVGTYKAPDTKLITPVYYMQWEP